MLACCASGMLSCNPQHAFSNEHKIRAVECRALITQGRKPLALPLQRVPYVNLHVCSMQALCVSEFPAAVLLAAGSAAPACLLHNAGSDSGGGRPLAGLGSPHQECQQKTSPLFKLPAKSVIYGSQTADNQHNNLDAVAADWAALPQFCCSSQRTCPPTFPWSTWLCDWAWHEGYLHMSLKRYSKSPCTVNQHGHGHSGPALLERARSKPWPLALGRHLRYLQIIAFSLDVDLEALQTSASVWGAAATPQHAPLPPASLQRNSRRQWHQQNGIAPRRRAVLCVRGAKLRLCREQPL